MRADDCRRTTPGLRVVHLNELKRERRSPAPVGGHGGSGFQSAGPQFKICPNVARRPDDVPRNGQNSQWTEDLVQMVFHTGGSVPQALYP